MRENSRFECLANIRCKKENRAYSIKMVVLFQNQQHPLRVLLILVSVIA